MKESSVLDYIIDDESYDYNRILPYVIQKILFLNKPFSETVKIGSQIITYKYKSVLGIKKLIGSSEDRKDNIKTCFINYPDGIEISINGIKTKETTDSVYFENYSYEKKCSEDIMLTIRVTDIGYSTIKKSVIEFKNRILKHNYFMNSILDVIKKEKNINRIIVCKHGINFCCPNFGRAKNVLYFSSAEMRDLDSAIECRGFAEALVEYLNKQGTKVEICNKITSNIETTIEICSEKKAEIKKDW